MTAASKDFIATSPLERLSARVAAVATILDCDESDVRLMPRDGELEGQLL